MEVETCIQDLNNTLKNKTQEPSKDDGLISHTSNGQKVHRDYSKRVCSEEGG